MKATVVHYAALWERSEEKRKLGQSYSHWWAVRTSAKVLRTELRALICKPVPFLPGLFLISRATGLSLLSAPEDMGVIKAAQEPLCSRS